MSKNAAGRARSFLKAIRISDCKITRLSIHDLFLLKLRPWKNLLIFHKPVKSVRNESFHDLKKTGC